MTVHNELEDKKEAALDKACEQFGNENSHLSAFYDRVDGFIPGFEMGWDAALEAVRSPEPGVDKPSTATPQLLPSEPSAGNMKRVHAALAPWWMTIFSAVGGTQETYDKILSAVASQFPPDQPNVATEPVKSVDAETIGDELEAK